MHSNDEQLIEGALWERGRDGCHTYRIPALAVTTRGVLLAFCEGRRDSVRDTGKIDLLVKRSLDNGASWSPQQVVWSDNGHTCGNPSPVVDRTTGTVWLLMTWNRGDDNERQIIGGLSKDTRRVFVTSSRDEGQTWSKPEEITRDVKKTDWTWYATGPGGGIQVEQGPHAGRLVIPCDHVTAASGEFYSHVIYSDDHGRSWQLGGRSPRGNANECEVVELSGGRLMLNMRGIRAAPERARQVAFSADGGATWQDQSFDANLVEPVCQASIRRYSWPGPGRRSVILFSNPADRENRVNLTVRASFDEGATWPAGRMLNAGMSGYSDLAVLGNGQIACLYESGKVERFSEELTLARFPLAWLGSQGGA